MSSGQVAVPIQGSSEEFLFQSDNNHQTPSGGRRRRNVISGTGTHTRQASSFSQKMSELMEAEQTKSLKILSLFEGRNPAEFEEDVEDNYEEEKALKSRIGKLHERLDKSDKEHRKQLKVLKSSFNEQSEQLKKHF